MDVYWRGAKQSEFTDAQLLRPEARLIQGWVWPVHPQLRNGLALSPLNSNIFYLNQQHELLTLNVAASQQTRVWPKEERSTAEITCFSIIDHYAVVGTDSGQLAVLDISDDHKETWAGPLASGSFSMVNYVLPHRHGDEQRIAVCSNNNSVYVFTFPEMAPRDRLSLDRSTNSAAISPDGKWMVVVGDRSELYLFEAGNEGFSLSQVVSHIGEEVYGGNGGNMATWEPHPPYRFAVASEVGATLVFAHPDDDGWSPNPLYYLWNCNVEPWAHATTFPIHLPMSNEKITVRRGDKMASAKFITSSGSEAEGSSLLVCCSVRENVHIYDLNRNLRQAVDLGSLPCVKSLGATTPLEISGVMASTDGSKIYVALDLAKGVIVELAVNRLASLRDQCIRFVKQNLHQWPEFEWETHLPSSLLSEIFSPYKFP